MELCSGEKTLTSRAEERQKAEEAKLEVRRLQEASVQREARFYEVTEKKGELADKAAKLQVENRDIADEVRQLQAKLERTERAHDQALGSMMVTAGI